MIINGIQLNGYKGRTASYHFEAPLVTITGRNGCGKTSILEAIHIATCGRHKGLSPKVNTRTDGIMRDLGPDEWSIVLETNKGTATYKVTPSIITHEADGIDELDLFPMSEFMSLSGPARSRALAVAAGVEKYEAELKRFEGEASEALNGETFTLEGSIIDQAMVIQERLKYQAKHLKGALDALPTMFEPTTPEPDMAKLAADREMFVLVDARLEEKQANLKAIMAAKGIEKADLRALETYQAAFDQASEKYERLAEILRRLYRERNHAQQTLAHCPRPQEWNPAATCPSCGASAEHWTRTEEDVNAANASAKEKERLAREAYEAKGAEIDSMEPTAAEAEAAKTAAFAELTSAQSRHAVLSNLEGVDMTTEEEVMAIQADYNDLEQTVAEANAAAEEWTRYRANESAREVIVSEREPVAAVLKELNAWLKELGSRVFDDVLEIGNKVTETALGVKFAFNKGTFVIWREGIRIPYEGMSGSEKALCSMALSIGLQMRSSKIVFLDEFHVFDEGTRDKIETTLEDMLMDQTLDGVFIVRPTDADLEVS